MNPPPPPPPPHGNAGTKGSGLPAGNYDIFIIPPHSSGSGFLYLPSLQTHRNSFLAGVASTVLTLAIWSIVYPVLKEWFATIVASGGVSVVLLLGGVGVAGWAWGRAQAETTEPGGGEGPAGAGGAGAGGAGGSAHAHGFSEDSTHTGAYTSGGPQAGRRPPPRSTPQPPPGSGYKSHTNGFPDGGPMPQSAREPPPQSAREPPPQPRHQPRYSQPPPEPHHHHTEPPPQTGYRPRYAQTPPQPQPQYSDPPPQPGYPPQYAQTPPQAEHHSAKPPRQPASTPAPEASQPSPQHQPRPPPESTPQPTPQPPPQAAPQPQTMPQPSPQPQTMPQPAPQPTPEPATQSTPNPASQPTAQSSAQVPPQPKPQSTKESNPQTPTPATQPSVPQEPPQPDSQPQPQAPPQAHPEPPQPPPQPPPQFHSEPPHQDHPAAAPAQEPKATPKGHPEPPPASTPVAESRAPPMASTQQPTPACSSDPRAQHRSTGKRAGSAPAAEPRVVPNSTWQRTEVPAAEPRPSPKSTWQRAAPGSVKADKTDNIDISKNTNESGTGKSAWEKAKEEMRKSESAAVKSAWERAREETRKKEEERKKAEEEQRIADEIARQKEEEEKERIKRREKFREAREKKERERALQEKARTEKELREKPELPKPTPQPSIRRAEPPRTPSPTKRHQQPTTKTATADDSYSYRPYDKAKRSIPTATSASSLYSESSYAPSFSTSRTTPPPISRGPYQSKDPDKIVLRAVYSFNNTFTKLPIAQLVSGVGSVTDGLVLRITTEGLFIDDDVRGVPQREWDIKAWTLKLLEVWCPHMHASSLGASSGSTPAAVRTTGFFGGKKSALKQPSSEESDEFVTTFMRICKSANSTPLGEKPSNRNLSSQTGESKGLHVLRANIRDQEGKRYVFVLSGEEGWKVAVGLQRLRRGTQVRALGVSGMSQHESKGILENMGWGTT